MTNLLLCSPKETNMANHEDRSQDFLNLSWPHSVRYHVDIDQPNPSSLSGDDAAEFSETSGQEPVTTYNGVPRNLLRNAQPLLEDEIRLLDLEMGTRDMPLTGFLRIVRLADHPVYEPLSYTWEDYDTVQFPEGDLQNDVHPLLFLLDTDLCLGLTPNCAKALSSVRQSTAHRTIWVDSICVNQDDPKERSHQVDRMKEIYSRAFNVLVYLGRETTEHDSSSSLAMALLRQPDRLKEPDQLHPRETTSLKRLFERRYFRRMWIVQEVALAQTLEFHCGPDISYISSFAGRPLESLLGSQVTPPWLRHSKQTVVNEELRPYKKSQAQQILFLIFDTELCDCKDDRDRIFALLSLLNAKGEEPLGADYSLSTAQVYSGLAAYLSKNGFLWSVLVLAPHLALTGCPGLPSWVPDWGNLGGYGISASRLQNPMVYKGSELGSGPELEVSSSGVITVEAMFLGYVTDTGHSCDYPFQDSMLSENQRSTRELFAKQCVPDGPSQSCGQVSIWTLAKTTKASQNKSLGSWECHLNFGTRCRQPRNTHHLAFMLPDYSTVLILRQHDRFPNQYTLVEAGNPQVGAVLPRDWEVDFQTRPRLDLRFLSHHINSNMDADVSSLSSSYEAFPLLSNFSRLWSLNPSTMSATLTHRAMEEINNLDISELNLLHQWQKHHHRGIQVLRDKTRLRRLIDEVDSLRRQAYVEREMVAGLDRQWSLNHFLGLFIADPNKHEPTGLPDVQVRGTLPLDETDLLPQLMQWAQVTRLVLRLLSRKQGTVSHWTELLMDEDLHVWASIVADIQLSRHESCGPSRTSVLLEKILRHLPEESRPGVEQNEESCFRKDSDWDWKKFNVVVEQMTAILDHIRPDVDKIQTTLSFFKPNFLVVAAHQLFAAHGVNVSKSDFTQIRIR